MDETRELMRLLGIDERRLRLKWVSASEGALFAAEIQNYVTQLKELGDNPLSVFCRMNSAKQIEPPKESAVENR